MRATAGCLVVLIAMVGLTGCETRRALCDEGDAMLAGRRGNVLRLRTGGRHRHADHRRGPGARSA
jgi:hypothetical protein